jgi:hypothetical protein
MKSEAVVLGSCRIGSTTNDQLQVLQSSAQLFETTSASLSGGGGGGRNSRIHPMNGLIAGGNSSVNNSRKSVPNGGGGGGSSLQGRDDTMNILSQLQPQDNDNDTLQNMFSDDSSVNSRTSRVSTLTNNSAAANNNNNKKKNGTQLGMFHLGGEEDELNKPKDMFSVMCNKPLSHGYGYHHQTLPIPNLSKRTGSIGEQMEEFNTHKVKPRVLYGYKYI